MTIKRIDGPYRVKPIGRDYEVLYLDEKNNFQKLIPHKIYRQRANAHRRAATLNKQWQKEQVV